ncbi:MAG: hypothetical protein ACO21G_04875 [Algoriphagus sp.]
MLSPAQLDALISLLDDSDWEVKQHVREKLIDLGAAVIPVLEQKWEESFNPVLQKELEAHEVHRCLRVDKDPNIFEVLQMVDVDGYKKL